MFRISDVDFIYLNDEPKGSHKCFAYLETLDLWVKVRIFNFCVYSYDEINYEDIKEIEEEILS